MKIMILMILFCGTCLAQTKMPSQGECLVWKDTVVSQKIRKAIAVWAGVSVAALNSKQTLVDLAHISPRKEEILGNIEYKIGRIVETSSLIASMNDHNVFTSPWVSEDSSISIMKNSFKSSQDLFYNYSILMIEDVVWRNGTLDNFCKYYFGM